MQPNHPSPSDPYLSDSGEKLVVVASHDLAENMRVVGRDIILGSEAFHTVDKVETRGGRSVITFKEFEKYRGDRPAKPITRSVKAGEYLWVAEASLPPDFTPAPPAAAPKAIEDLPGL